MATTGTCATAMTSSRRCRLRFEPEYVSNACCSDHPDEQEKFRRVVMQGHIDAEDFNGVSPHFIDLMFYTSCS